MTMERMLRDMPLHEQMTITDQLLVTRVPGGLLYQVWGMYDSAVALAFVPLDVGSMKPGVDLAEEEDTTK